MTSIYNMTPAQRAEAGRKGGRAKRARAKRAAKLKPGVQVVGRFTGHVKTIAAIELEGGARTYVLTDGASYGGLDFGIAFEW